MKSKDIALSAISAAFTAISLILGSYFSVIDILTIAIATIAVMLPLYRKSYLGSLFAYLVGGGIAMLANMNGLMQLIYPAFFLFAGPYPVVNALFKKLHINKWAAYVIKLVWCYGAVYLIYWLCTAVFGLPFTEIEFIQKNAWYLLAAFALVFFVLFDFCINRMQWFIDRYMARIIK